MTIYQYGAEGCFIDYSQFTTDSLNHAIVNFALTEGFEIEAADDLNADGVDLIEAYAYLADEAVIYLNDNCVGTRMSFEIQDNSLFLRADEPTKSEYNDMLDECYGDISICGIDYTASSALKSVDPIAYRVGFSDYVSSVFDE